MIISFEENMRIVSDRKNIQNWFLALYKKVLKN